MSLISVFAVSLVYNVIGLQCHWLSLPCHWFTVSQDYMQSHMFTMSLVYSEVQIRQCRCMITSWFCSFVETSQNEQTAQTG